jgi:hypothetical protein
MIFKKAGARFFGSCSRIGLNLLIPHGNSCRPMIYIPHESAKPKRLLGRPMSSICPINAAFVAKMRTFGVWRLNWPVDAVFSTNG